MLYDYDPSRSGQVPVRLLAGFSGYLQTDGYEGYNAVVRGTAAITPVGCMAHVRRRFSDTVKGVHTSANLYSLIETAKVNGLEPYGYLRRVFTELPRAETVEQVEVLLPGIAAADHTPVS